MEHEETPAFDTIESITSRSNFVSPLDIKDSEDDRFDSIIQPYRLGEEKIKCGIASCRTPNLNGFIIRLKDGTETNVGNVCGLTHFKADFKSEVRRHREIQARRLKLERVRSLKGSPEILNRLERLHSEYSTLKARRMHLRAALNRSQDDRLSRLGKLKDGRIFKHKTLHGRDLEIYLESNPSARNSKEPPSIPVLIGEIKGVSFFSVPRKDEAVLDFLTPLREIYATSDEDIANWKPHHLNTAHKWIGTLTQDMDKLESIIAQGQLFFKPSNLDNLSLIGVTNLSALRG